MSGFSDGRVLVFNKIALLDEIIEVVNEVKRHRFFDPLRLQEEIAQLFEQHANMSKFPQQATQAYVTLHDAGFSEEQACALARAIYDANEKAH